MSTFSSANVTDGNLLLKERTHTINNKIQLHMLGMPPNKLGNWIIAHRSIKFQCSQCVTELLMIQRNISGQFVVMGGTILHRVVLRVGGERCAM